MFSYKTKEEGEFYFRNKTENKREREKGNPHSQDNPIYVLRTFALSLAHIAITELKNARPAPKLCVFANPKLTFAFFLHFAILAFSI